MHLCATVSSTVTVNTTGYTVANATLDWVGISAQDTWNEIPSGGFEGHSSMEVPLSDSYVSADLYTENDLGQSCSASSNTIYMN